MLLVLTRFDTAFGKENENRYQESSQFKVEVQNQNSESSQEEKDNDNDTDATNQEVRNSNGKSHEQTIKWENYNQFKVKKGNFDIKGKITSFSATEMTLNGIGILLDASVSKELKITGNPKVGAYAMAKGIIVDNKYYAEKVATNNRSEVKNNHENETDSEDDDENETNENSDSTINPSISPTPTPNSIETTNSENNTIQIETNSSFIVQQLIEILRGLANALSALATN